MKNIYFIEAKSPGANVFSQTPMPREGSILLGTILENLGYNVKVFIEDIVSFSYDMIADADLICISAITPTIKRAFEIAENVKKEFKIPTVIGGPHSTFLDGESLLHVDYVVRGEGERTIVELVEAMSGKLSLDNISGLSFMRDGQIIRNVDRKLNSDLNKLPILNYDLVYGWNKRILPISTSRGCPFGCRFCSVIQMFGCKYRFKEVERICNEIEAMLAHNPKYVFFIDDNFTAIKSRTKKLLREFLRRGFKFKWSAQVRADAAKDLELVRLMAEAGCFNVYIGFESVNPKTLKAYNKGQSLEDIENSIRIFQQHSINIHGMFVLGADTDDIHTIGLTTKFAKRLKLNSIQFMMLTPFPGTPVFGDLKTSGRIIHIDWSKYDAQHAVFEPKQMSIFELHVETLKAMGRFYSWRAVFVRLAKQDLLYFFVMIYGRKSIKNALGRKKIYFNEIREKIADAFDKEGLRKKLAGKKEAVIGVVINNPSNIGQREKRFFGIFLKELLKHNNAEVESCDDVSAHDMVFGEKKEKIGIADIKTFSLFNVCDKIGILLKIKRKKVRRAYEEALKSIGGKPFECHKVQLLYNK